MCITNYTDDYNLTVSRNKKCTNNGTKIEIVIPLFAIIPCSMSLICLIPLMAYVYFSQTFIE